MEFNNKNPKISPVGLDEYINRLRNLLPPGSVQNHRLVIQRDTITEASQMVESISGIIFEVLSDFADVDLVQDMKNSCRDLQCLGQFLGISFQTIMEE